MPRSSKTVLAITLGLLFVAGLLAARIGLPQPDPFLSGSSAKPSTPAVSQAKGVEILDTRKLDTHRYN